VNPAGSSSVCVCVCVCDGAVRSKHNLFSRVDDGEECDIPVLGVDCLVYNESRAEEADAGVNNTT